MGKYSKMLLSILVISLAALVNADSNDSVIYNMFTGLPATDEELETFEAAGITDTCTNVVQACDPDGWRPVDGSCNNLEHVDSGMYCTPQLRLVEADYNVVNGTYQPRLTQSGKEFGPRRAYRQHLLAVGDVEDDYFNQWFSLCSEGFFADIGSVHDITNYIFETTYCCEERGKTDPMCAPNYISDTDYVHRFTDIRCMNMTTPKSFQNVGCTSSDTPPDRLNFQTLQFDLSCIYAYLDNILPSIKANHSGLLKTEIYNGTELPSAANETTTCMLEDAIKTGCTRDVPNGLLGANSVTTLFWMNHNIIVRKLAEINPCWSSDELFETGRNINIAMYTQIIYYDWLVSLIGSRRLIEKGIISEDLGHRDIYDSSEPPRISLQGSYIFRYFHVAQNGIIKKYDKNDTYVSSTLIPDYTFRVQDLAVNNELEYVINGMRLQRGGKLDQMVTAELSESGVGTFQRALDVPTYDMYKGDLFAVGSYTKICDFCYNKTHTSYEDIEYLISEEKLNMLRGTFESVHDIPLIVGAWYEDLSDEGHVPPIVACLLMDQFKRNIVTDRYWYERDSRPHAFTSEQLAEIRKVNMARFLCDSGHVLRMQPRAFLIVGENNALQSCEDFPSVDYTAWKDDSCDCEDE